MSRGESETTRIRIMETTWRLMEEQQGQGVRMSDIAAAAGVSRQALYLHFSSRTQLLVETTRWGDEIRGLEERMNNYRAASSGVEVLIAYVEFWGNYIPEIYPIARALLAVKENDEAAATAWDDRMVALRDCCRYTIDALRRDNRLPAEWSAEEATDALLTLLSIQNWQQLTLECGWSQSQYVNRMQAVTQRIFVQ